MPISEKQLAANRANAARSTGPRTSEGKARSAQNARTHGFAATAYTIVRAEGLEDLADIRADLIAAYRPVNSEEVFALERLAIARHTLLRVARLEAGLFSCGVNQAVDFEGAFRTQPNLDVTSAQGFNHALADGFLRMVRDDRETWKLFLRYQAQTERHYRRAIEEFERLKSLRAELPNEPILESEPQPDQPVAAPPLEPDPAPDPPAPPPAIDPPPAPSRPTLIRRPRSPWSEPQK